MRLRSRRTVEIMDAMIAAPFLGGLSGLIILAIVGLV